MVPRGDYGPKTLVASGFSIGRHKVDVRLDTVFSRALYLSTGLNPQIYATNTAVHSQRSTYKNIFHFGSMEQPN